MRFLNSLGLGLAIVLAAGRQVSAQPASGGNVAATWHFAGGAGLADNTNFDNVKKILAIAPSRDFQDLALNRFSAWLAGTLFSSTNAETASALRPLLDDLFSTETIWTLGGASNGPLNFIVALRLNDPRAKAWQDAFLKLFGKPGEDFTTNWKIGNSSTARQWKLAGGKSFWFIHARDWLLVGSGDDLADNLGALRAQYIRAVIENKDGRPAPALQQSWLEADLDWHKLAHWLPNFPTILQLARTQITFTAPDHSLYMTAKVTYPKAMPWKFEPWRIPTNLIFDPLVSFTAGQDVAAYMDPAEPLSQLTDNPLTGQFYVWSLGQMVLQSYGAWPVADASNSLHRIVAQATNAFNPDLNRIGGGQLIWHPERGTLLWSNRTAMFPGVLQVAPDTNGQYLLADFFPLNPRGKPAPDELFQQVRGRTNLVYYDWEGTGQRLASWQLLSVALPVLPRTPLSSLRDASTNNPPARPRTPPPAIIEENWLAGVTPLLVDHETITEITRTGPAELTIVRKSPFAFSSLELVLLSHWLTGTGSIGINRNLLPPPAKVTGPGINPQSR